jgi:hypothetical protein
MDGEWSTVHRWRPLLDLVDDQWLAATLSDDGMLLPTQ